MSAAHLLPLACFLVYILSGIYSASAEISQHPALLPAPQQIIYTNGTLTLHGLHIAMPTDAASEDIFAARQLVTCLASRIGEELPLAISSNSGPEIRLHRTGAIDALPQPGETPGPHSREAYSLVIGSHGGQIEAKSSAGLFYGVETLCQLVEADGTLPAVRVEDWPAQAYRGTMVDMSEGPLPTEAEIKRQIDFLARWKANQYYFYNEANIELTGYPLLNSEARFTRQQIESIVAYARERHIDVVPCLEMYGHLHDLFRIEKYSSLADFPHGGEFNPRDPRVMQLLTDWVDQFSAMFPSSFVHIGFDETGQIEQAAAKQGKGTTAVDLFIEQLSNVSRLFQQHHKTVMAWADIMVQYPGIVEKLPPGTIAVAWYYDPNPDPEYHHWLDPLLKQKIPFFVAPGVNGWSEIYPDFNLTFANIDTFIAAGRRSGALGVMNTSWTDDQQALRRLSWPGFAYGAVAAWQNTPIDHASFFANYTRQFYPISIAANVTTALAMLNQSELHLQHALGQGTMFEVWRNPFAADKLTRSRTHREDLRQSRLLAEQAEESLARIPEGADTTGTLDDLVLSARLLDYAGLKFLYADEIDEAWQSLGPHPSGDRLNGFIGDLASEVHGRLPDLMDAITELRPHYQQAWLAEYNPYRMTRQLGRWDAEYENWRRIQVRLDTFSENYKANTALPALPALESFLGGWN